MTSTDKDSVHFYLPYFFRDCIEKNYYEKINQELVLENVIKDPSFLENPLDHIALYTDHGVVHVRNVTALILDLIPRINGVLFPKRERERLEFIKGYGAILAYIHDIGMINATPFGRATHAEFIAHEVFSPEFEPLIDMIWQNNIGNVPWRILSIHHEHSFAVAPKIILRELLALAYCHSKTAVPINYINDPAELKNRMQYCLSHTLTNLYQQKKNHQQTDQKNTGRQTLLKQYYQDYLNESYAWLIDIQKQSFIEDVLDTVRTIRCADALRQRGTDLKTSGNYQIFIDQKTANAIYALQNANNEMYLLEGNKPINAAEANLASVNITHQGDLHFSFYRGQFASETAIRQAADNLIVLIEDIQADVLDSFFRPKKSLATIGHYMKKNQPTYILLESTEDNPHFTSLLAAILEKTHPELSSLIKRVPAIQNAPDGERKRYLAGEMVTDVDFKQQVLTQIAKQGHKIDDINQQQAFTFVRKTTLNPGDILMSQGDYAGFVYIPLSEGLEGLPGGGYDMFQVAAWSLLGNTGVIRGDIRNATVLAKQTVDVLIIPKETFLQHWHATYSPAEFKKAIERKT